jgi:hypothetical protein
MWISTTIGAYALPMFRPVSSKLSTRDSPQHFRLKVHFLPQFGSLFTSLAAAPVGSGRRGSSEWV